MFLTLEGVQFMPSEATNSSGISMALDAECFLVLTGMDMSMISVFLDVLSGRHPVNGGRILFDGLDVTNGNEQSRSLHIGRVYRDSWRGLAPGMTVMEHLVLAHRR